MSVRLPSPLSSLGHITLVLYGMCCILSCFSIQLCVTLWTPTCQTPLSMGLSMQEYWSGLLCPPPGDLLNPGIEPESPVSPALAGEFFTTVQLARSFLKVLESFPHYPHPFIFLVKCEEWTLWGDERWFFSVEPHSAAAGLGLRL